MQGVSVALDPLGKHLGPLLAILDDVIQANLPKRKPKVAKGARDFGPREMTIRKPLFKASFALHLLPLGILKRPARAQTPSCPGVGSAINACHMQERQCYNDCLAIGS